MGRFTPFHLMRPHGSQKMCQSSDSVSVVRIPMKSSKSTPEAFSSWREIHTGYDRHTAAAATPQWATHAHAAILRSTVATATRATSASLLTLTLPHAEVQTFDGDPVNYCNFICSFENLIEAKMKNSRTRLYYLVQYTFSDVQELTWSCLSMQPEEGYQEAQRLLKARYG